MAFGASLVADDRTLLRLEKGALIASCPDPIKGLIEARGVGILTADSTSAPVVAVVDMARREEDRLPKPQEIDLLGQSVTLFAKAETPHFAAAILQFLKSGRQSSQCMPNAPS